MPKKKSTKRKAPKRSNVPRSTGTERLLVENFVSLQKVMVNFSSKFDNLSNQISKLLELFEISAKALAEKDFKAEKESKTTLELSKKMDSLLDQNKVLAKGLTLLHEKDLGLSAKGEELFDDFEEEYDLPPMNAPTPIKPLAPMSRPPEAPRLPSLPAPQSQRPRPLMTPSPVRIPSPNQPVLNTEPEFDESEPEQLPPEEIPESSPEFDQGGYQASISSNTGQFKHLPRI